MNHNHLKLFNNIDRIQQSQKGAWMGTKGRALKQKLAQFQYLPAWWSFLLRITLQAKETVFYP